jgi:hypothetical protein
MGMDTFGGYEARCLGGSINGMAEAFSIFLAFYISVTEEWVTVYVGEQVEDRIGLCIVGIGRTVYEVACRMILRLRQLLF